MKRKKRYFSLVSQFPIFEFINAQGPIILLKVGDRQIHVIQARRVQGKFFHNDLGLFELDGEYEMKMMGQPFYLFNLSNSKPISLPRIEKVQKLYRENHSIELTRELERVNNACEKAFTITDKDKNNIFEYNPTSPLNALRELTEATEQKKGEKKSLFDFNDIKFLINYKTFDKSALKIFELAKMMQKKPEFDTCKKIHTLVPLLLLSIAGIGLVVLMRFFNPLRIFPELGNAFINSMSLLGAFL